MIGFNFLSDLCSDTTQTELHSEISCFDFRDDSIFLSVPNLFLIVIMEQENSILSMQAEI